MNTTPISIRLSKTLIRILSALTLLLALHSPLHAQDEGDEETGGKGGWPGLPPFKEGQLSVYSQGTFLAMAGAAILSYALSEFVFKEENLNFYQVRGGFYRGANNTNVWVQNFGIEKRVSHWFALAVEFNLQEFSQNQYSGMGMGLNTYYRWYLFGRKRVSPFMEHGAGLFQGFKPFPQGGSNFTFNLTSKIGLEYTSKNGNKIRATYGHLHQSNNDLIEPNPGMDANGLSISYSWFWKSSKW